MEFLFADYTQKTEALVTGVRLQNEAFDIYELQLLGLDKTDAQVALIQNAKSSKMGKKDVLKIATDKFDLNLDAVAYLAPHTTVNVICGGKAAEKQALRLPEKLVNMVHCPNPACISNHEQVDDVFTLVDPDKGTYRCLYCETAAK